MSYLSIYEIHYFICKCEKQTFKLHMVQIFHFLHHAMCIYAHYISLQLWMLCIIIIMYMYAYK